MPDSDGGEHRPADDPVGAEIPQAIGRIVERYTLRLAVEQHSDIGQEDEKAGVEMSGDPRRAPQHHGSAVKAVKEWPCLVAKRQGRGFDADARVVLLVLMRVNRVVAERPADA